MWLEIAVVSSEPVAEELSAILMRELACASAGTELRAGEVVFWVDESEGENAAQQTQAKLSELAARGMAVDPKAVTVRPAVPEAEWREAWKKYFRTTKLTRQLIVAPSWDPYIADSSKSADDAELIIDLDPGLAFGTGLHASTQLVLTILQALKDTDAQPTRLFDVGTGSGILMIAAAKLWPQLTALGVDNDPLAIDAAHDNIANNVLTDRIKCATAELSAVSEQFGLITANIQSEVLIDMRADLEARLAADGLLILSGIISELADTTCDAFTTSSRLALVERRDSHDHKWTALCFRMR